MLFRTTIAISLFAVSLFTADLSAAAQEESWIEEVIVTAQKREQSSQDVGIAIAAFTGTDLRDQGVDQAQQLSDLISNVSLQNVGGGGVPIVIVRGIGLQNFRINDSPTTAFYVDDVYQTSVASAEWTMFDLQRVEMLKGPQGGLYGRNALGGAVQIISTMPQIGEAPNGYVAVDYGEYSKTIVEAAASMGLSDSMAMRFAGRWVNSSDAAYNNVTLNKKQGEIDRYAARFLFRFAPSDTTDILLKIHGGKDDSELPPLRPIGFYANIGNGAALGAPDVSLGFLNGVLGLGLGDPLCPSIRAGEGSDPSNCATITGVTPDSYGISSGPRNSPSSTDGFQQNSWSGASLNMRFDMGNYTFQSITAYDSIDYRRFVDFDGTPVEHQHIDYNTSIDAFSQEFRLFYNGSDTSSWVIGINYAQDKLDEASILFGANGILPLFFGGATFSPQSYDQKTTALAVFGHGEWSLSETWNLITELRYTDAEKKFAGGSELGFANGFILPFVSIDDKTDFQSPSGKISLEWSPNEAALLYFSVSRGFKTGGFFGGFPTSVEQLAPFDEETVLAYEAGWKIDLASGRLRINGNVFFYDRSNVQQNAADPNSTLGIKRITNIGDVEAYGAELDLTWVPSDPWLFVLGFGTTNSEVTKSDFIQSSSIPLLPDTPIEGTNTPNYAKFTANFLGRFQRPMRDNSEWWLQIDGHYRTKTDLSVITNPIEKAVFQEGAYGLVNLRAGFGSRDGTWQIQAYVENVTDRTYRNTIGNDGTFGIYELYGLPRVWGVRYMYSWE